MRTGFVILLVYAIVFICGCNQVENPSSYGLTISERLESLRVDVAEIRHQIMHLRADIRKIQTSKAPAVPKTPPDTTVYTIDIDDSPFLGAKEAAVTIMWGQPPGFMLDTSRENS